MEMKLLSFWFACLIYVISNRSSVIGTIEQVRWCYVTDDRGAGNWMTYPDGLSSCATCGSETKIIEDRSSSSNDKCCDDDVFRQSCDFACNSSNDILACGNGENVCMKAECDGFNDCGDGSDELAFEECRPTRTTCQPLWYFCGNNKEHHQCYNKDKVCNGVKDCFSGSDEMNCLYYEGRCPGFLCSELPQCVGKDVVCNGVKDCYDGTDEMLCEDSVRCNDLGLFQCSPQSTNCATNLIVQEKLCNGISDCIEGNDEDNCYFWSSWSLWMSCNCSSSLFGSHQRRRNCATFHDINVHVEGRCNGTQEQEENCACTTEVPTDTTLVTAKVLSPVFIAIITLGGVIFFVCAAICIYYCWSQSLKQRKQQNILFNNNKLREAPSISHLSLGGDSVFSTNGSFAPRPTIQLSPASPLLFRRPMHGSAPLLNTTTIQGNSLHPVSIHRSKLNLPLPSRPGEEDIYERIKEPIIDPYAETREIGIFRSRSSVTLSPLSSISPFRLRSSSISSHYDNDCSDQDFSATVRTYSLSSERNSKNRSNSRASIENHELGPPIPSRRLLMSSNETLGQGRNMLPVASPNHSYASYTSMSSASPENRRRFSPSTSQALSGERQKKHRLNKAQRRTMQTHRLQRFIDEQNTSKFHHTRSLHLHRTQASEDVSYYSDSYAIMTGGAKVRQRAASQIQHSSRKSRKIKKVQGEHTNKAMHGEGTDLTSLERCTMTTKTPGRDILEKGIVLCNSFSVTDKEEETAVLSESNHPSETSQASNPKRNAGNYTKVLPKSKMSVFQKRNTKSSSEKCNRNVDKSSSKEDFLPLSLLHGTQSSPYSSLNKPDPSTEKPYDKLLRDDVKRS